MSTHRTMPGESPYEVDRSDEQEPEKSNGDKSQNGEEVGKKTDREVDPPIKRKPNNPDKPAE
ncbi:MAG: hypothetical protein ACE37N_01605 [Pseudohongiellaceae bacterium]